LLTKQRPRPAPQPDLNWFEDAVELPRAGTVDTRKLQQRQRLVRWYVWGSVVATPVLALLALVSAAKGGGGGPASASLSAPPGAELAAWKAVQTWFGQSPSPLPGGHIVTWAGATPIARAKPPRGSGEAGPPEDAWDERFLAENSRAWYDIDQEVVLVGNQWSPIASPSFFLAPTTGSATGTSGASPWPGLSTSANVPGPVNNAISSWLAAYTSGNPQTLLQATGDPSTADAYVPLTGVSQASVAGVVAAANYGPPGQMIVEAQFDITWDGQSAQPGPTTMDLLVERAGTATPVVVAWGPPGSGPTLRPYENAVPAGTG
jgi:hypothetical protein